MGLHRCPEAECPHFGQATTRGCRCHKTDEQVLIGLLVKARDAANELEISSAYFPRAEIEAVLKQVQS